MSGGTIGFEKWLATDPNIAGHQCGLVYLSYRVWSEGEQLPYVGYKMFGKLIRDREKLEKVWDKETNNIIFK